MNERLTLQDLIDLLAKKREITKKEAETFLRELFALIAESIEGNDVVKIKDFGTFKLVLVNSRKSVDVNTGAAIEIAAHYKLSFTPEKALREAINRPFAHFESVILEDNVTFDNMKEELENSSINNESDNSGENIENTENVNKSEEVEQPVNPLPDEEGKALENKVDDAFADIDEQMASMTEDEPVTIGTLNKDDEAAIDIDNLEVGEPMVRMDDPTDESDDITIPEPEVVEAPTLTDEEEAEEVETVPEEEAEVVESLVPTRIEEEDEDEEWMEDRSFGDKLKENSGLVAFIIILLLLGIGFVGYKFFYTATDMIDKAVIDNKMVILDSIAADSIAAADSLKLATDSMPTDTIPPLSTAISGTADGEKPKADDKKEGVKPPVKAPDSKPAKQKETKPASKPKVITLQQGQTLRQIGLEYYGNKSFWVYIYQENKAKISNPNSIALGTSLTLPTREKYGIDPKSAASLKKAKALESKLFKEFDIK